MPSTSVYRKLGDALNSHPQSTELIPKARPALYVTLPDFPAELHAPLGMESGHTTTKPAEHLCETFGREPDAGHIA